MKKLFKASTPLLIVIALFATASCSKDAIRSTVEDTTTNAITFTENISTMATKATDTIFETNDQISVSAYDSAGALYASNVTYTYDGSLFSSTSPITYGSGDAARLLFRAIYPVAELTEDLTVDFTVKSDQSEGSNYTLSDLMSSSTSYTAENSPNLTFNHILTKMVFTISYSDVDLNNVVSTVNASTSVNFNVSTLEYSATDGLSTITMVEDAINSYKAIIIPQSYSAGDSLGNISVNGVDYEIVLENDVEFYSGVQYTYYLKIENNGISYTEPMIEDWDEVTINDEDQGTPVISVITENSYGHIVGRDLYMDGRSNAYGIENKSFLDLETGIVYDTCDVMEHANEIDVIFYDSSSEKSALCGPGKTDTKLENYYCNGTSLTEQYPDYYGVNINSQTIYFRVLNPETTAHANLIAAFEAGTDNLSLSSRSSLITSLATPSSEAPNIIPEVTTYDGKNFDPITYTYCLLYSDTDNIYGIIKLTEIKFNSTSGVSSIMFDYIWGC